MNWFARLFASRRPIRRIYLGFEQLEQRDNPAVAWETLTAIPAPTTGATAYLHPQRYRPFEVDATVMRTILATAPLDTGRIGADALILTLPAPDGRDQRFAVVDAPIMAPELAAQFPEITTYRGQGLDDSTATVRLDLTPQGFHAQVIAAAGTWYIDPYYHLETRVHISYFRKDLRAEDVFARHTDGTVETVRAWPTLEGETPIAERTGEAPFGKDVGPGHGWRAGRPCVCELCRLGALGLGEPPPPPPVVRPPELPALMRSGAQLRTYRAAVAATGEYTQFHGGTVALGQAAIVTAMNRVVGVYETELSIRMVLVPNNSSLVFTNPNTDPYSNFNGSTMLTQNQTTVTNVIGSANYDIGHVFSTGGGGIASLRSVGVNSRKAQGVTGQGAPIGDSFTIDYVAHEIGHQFGANHSFNTSSAGGARNSQTAYEPGSGSTIMAYAGITGSNSDLQSNSDPFFNTSSFDEIISYVDVSIPGVGTRTATGNIVPTVSAGTTFAIPARTPFELTAVGSDANGDVLTYSWEQRNLGPAVLLNAADNGSSPLFRVFNPILSPTRTFPRLSNLVNNTVPLGEKLPTTNWSQMRFRVTARDNRSGGGGVNTADMFLQVVNTGTAFTVTAPNTAVTWNGNSNQIITWDVAGTTANPIGATSVNITLSLDGGFTYPITLASAVPNSGSAVITVPNLDTTLARIRVQPTNNIFFDISNVNFRINAVPVIAGVGVNDGISSQRSRVTSLRVTFDSVVNLADGAFRLTRVGLPNGASGDGAEITSGGANPQISVAAPTINGVTVATLTFTSGGVIEAGSLADGVWQLTVVGTAVARNGNAMPANFNTPTTGTDRIARLFGDLDGDGDVDALDFVTIRGALNSTLTSGNYIAAADFDGDGDIDAIDLLNARARLNVTI